MAFQACSQARCLRHGLLYIYIIYIYHPLQRNEAMLSNLLNKAKYNNKKQRSTQSPESGKILFSNATVRGSICTGVMDSPYGICGPWVRGGCVWDAMGKLFRRRRRRPLLNIFWAHAEYFHPRWSFCLPMLELVLPTMLEFFAYAGVGDAKTKDIITNHVSRSIRSTINEKRTINGLDTLPFGWVSKTGSSIN